MVLDSGFLDSGFLDSGFLGDGIGIQVSQVSQLGLAEAMVA